MSSETEHLHRSPLLRAVHHEEPPKIHPSYKIELWAGPIVFFHIALGTSIWYSLLADKASITDAFYFAVVTFLTIGYGDVLPATPTAKIFFMLYIVLSLVVQLTVVSTFVARAMSLGDTPTSAAAQSNPSIYFKIRPRVIACCQGLVILTGLVFAGASLLHYSSEDIGWLDCFYWALTTLSTVGYGDIVPEHHRGFFAVYFLVSVVIFTFVLGECISILVQIQRYRELGEFFENGLTPEILDRMDAFSDGQVSKLEFMIFMLEQLQGAEREQMDMIMRMFDSYDITKDGVLDVKDIRRRIDQPPEEAAGASTSGP